MASALSIVMRGISASVRPSAVIPPASPYENKPVIFALAGQSNEIGRFGPIDGILDATDPAILMFNAAGGSFVTAQDPLDHFDETANTVGPGLSFGKAFKSAYLPSEVILVGLALGGSGFFISDWVETTPSNQYANAIARWNAAYSAALALHPDLVVGGMIWIQGEDEVTDYPSELGSSRLFQGTLVNFVKNVRIDYDGFDADTPFVVSAIPAGSALTANAVAYANMQSDLEGVPDYVVKCAHAPGADLPVADDRHYTAASCRIMGTRQLAAFTSALSSLVTPPTVAAFVPDPANVETAIAIDVSATEDFKPIISPAGRNIWENKRVYIQNGAMQFDGNSELRIGNRLASGRPLLANRDFLLKCRWNADTVSNLDGIVGLWETTANNRSYLLRLSSGSLQFYGSNNGTTSTLMLSSSVSPGLWYDTEVRRVGTTLSMKQNGVTVGSYVLSAGFNFFAASTTYKFLIGDYGNGNNFQGEISKVSLEMLN